MPSARVDALKVFLFLNAQSLSGRAKLTPASQLLKRVSLKHPYDSSDEGVVLDAVGRKEECHPKPSLMERPRVFESS